MSVKLLALAAVMMVSGTMVGQAGKAADKPIIPFTFTPSDWPTWSATADGNGNINIRDPKGMLDCSWGELTDTRGKKTGGFSVTCIPKPAAPPVAKPVVASPTDTNTPSVTLFSEMKDAVLPQAKQSQKDHDAGVFRVCHKGERDGCCLGPDNYFEKADGFTDGEMPASTNWTHSDAPFDFNSPGPIAWKDPYYVKYKSGWMCTRELVEKRDTICFRMLELFHWAAFDCEKDSQVCRDLK